VQVIDDLRAVFAGRRRDGFQFDDDLVKA